MEISWRTFQNGQYQKYFKHKYLGNLPIHDFKKLFTLWFQLRQITEIARRNPADGNIVANLMDSGSNSNVPFLWIQNEANLNLIVNSNRLFINALAAILDFGMAIYTKWLNKLVMTLQVSFFNNCKTTILKAIVLM